MKKTLSLLAVAALAMSAAPGVAKDVTVRPYTEQINSITTGNTIGLSATLINSVTGGQVWYDLRDPAVDPPFNADKGHIYWGFELSDMYNNPIELDALSATAEDSAVRITADDSLILDFTYNNSTLSGPIEAEYVVVMFRHNNGEGDYFSTWYEKNSVGITGKFKNGNYDAYVIKETCDMGQTASTYGGLVFFNNSVAPQVRLAEVPAGGEPAVPEPTTATLSLLALAGLAARRRRK